MFEGSFEKIYQRIADRIYEGGIPIRITGLLYRGIPGIISEGGTSPNYQTLWEERGDKQITDKQT